ncbi:DUF262 domain-containing HNH endonuclease family protein [Maribacter sp. BPC-D8]|uniref:DUF262 domain-containing protein n=1 Tax=Maribacter sp. BPC-D8 TaxID=3053613 RepID=UPI002B45CAD1|nr:DUF262 domain-containing HNH endonuclease family protein [Maribacter sp. BPC-D8]WRI28123.1 DUF262 domain-containing HNH endonuclease family protein [Maribacter sp. BPC-D8]
MQSKTTLENRTAESIQQLFKNSENVRIPAYQRAFSWGDKQCSQFLEDLLEQKGKKYYLGQILFEKDGNTLFIIDGQQRLTTTILFLSALAKIKILKGENVEQIRQTYLTDVFKTIDDDQVIFKKVTQKHLVSAIDDTETISQKRIIEAFNFFETELSKLEKENLNLIQQTLENAVISTFYITNKVEATQVFEYQNNRGKELSRFEVIKAYLMHQIYIQSSDNNQANNDIAEIQSIISKTYRYIEAVEGYFTENELLDNYCNLFFNIGGNIEAIKETLKKVENKSQWIKLFFESFVELAHSAKSIVSNKNQSNITNLFFVGNEANWKLVLLTLFYKGEVSGDSFKKILKLLEVLCFKLKLGDYRTDHLPNFAKRYFNQKDIYNIDNLYQDIKNVTETGFKWYWNDGDRFRNIIPNYFDNEKWHYNRNTIKYVLWQYENSLRIKNRSGALLDKELYNSYTIEHITPQNPADIEYTEEFRKNFLQLAGNLALLTQSQNSKFSNKSFKKKSELFQDTALSSYTEIREKNQWTETEITERHNRISEFAKTYFNVENEQ